MSARAAGGQRPIMEALDLLGRRWTMRVIWELRDGPLSFRDLQAACEGMSSSVLNQRLAELRDAAIAEPGVGGYRLTKLGAELIEAYRPLNAWADRWARLRHRERHPDGIRSGGR